MLTPFTPRKACTISPSRGDRNVRVGAKTPTRLPDSTASTASVTSIVDFPQRRPAHQDDAAMSADEIERLALRGVQGISVSSVDRAAGRLAECKFLDRSSPSSTVARRQEGRQ